MMTGQSAVTRRTWTVVLAMAAALVLCWASGTAAANSGSMGATGPAAPANGPQVALAVRLPPGDITGIVTAADGLAPHGSVPVALLDATGREVMTTQTGSDGAYVLKGVPAGTYTLRVGKPGLAAAMETSEGQDARPLNVRMPAASVAPPPVNVPKGLEGSPIQAAAIADGGSITLVATPAASGARRPGVGTSGSASTNGGNPGNPTPPAPPGRPPDKPLPPPFISPSRP
jgi:hypothetical protein